MTAYNSAASGSWGLNTNWSPNGIPTTGDTITILAAHNINLAADRAIRIINLYGTLTLDGSYDITYDNFAGAGIFVQDVLTASIVNSGTTHLFKSAGDPNPANRWSFQIEHVASGDDTRALNFDSLECSGNKSFLGNTTYLVEFDPTVGEYMHQPDPVVRRPKIEEHIIQGRSKSRIYPMANQAGLTQVEVRCLQGGFKWLQLMKLMESRVPVALTSDIVFLKRAFIEDIRPRRVRGTDFIDMTVYLAEDD